MRVTTLVDSYRHDAVPELLIPIVPLVSPEESARLDQKIEESGAREYAAEVRRRHGLD